MDDKVYDLTEWAVYLMEASPYAAPEQVYRRLGGLCPERAVALGLDPKEPILTTRVLWSNKAAGILTTENTRYRLVGEPHPAYVRWCAENGYPDPRSLLG